MRRGIRRRIRASFVEFFQLEQASGIMLIVAIAGALLLANSPYERQFSAIWHTVLPFSGTNLSLVHWINDGLMAVFFLLAGAEIKRELVRGELSSFKRAVMPIGAALGGMAVPAAIYYSLNAGTPEGRGWGIPMATDIAFSLGVLALLGSQIPIGLKVFLTALAIVDDLGAILVIAVFFSENLRLIWLGAAAVIAAALFLLGRLRVSSLVPYCLLGVPLWWCFLQSGVHATVGGVLLGFLIPIGSSGSRSDANMEPVGDSDSEAVRSDEDGEGDSGLFAPEAEESMNGQDELVFAGPIDSLIHRLHPWVAFAIVPLFAFANGGVSFSGVTVSNLAGPVPIGIVLGLVVGKITGIFSFSWVFAKLGIAKLPDGATWGQIAGIGMLAGIGFTMSLFIAKLALPDDGMVQIAKLGILIASLLSALIGYGWLRAITRNRAS